MKKLLVVLMIVVGVLALPGVYRYVDLRVRYPYRTARARQRLGEIRQYLMDNNIKDFKLGYYDYDDSFHLAVFDIDIQDLEWTRKIPLSELKIDYTHVKDLSPLACQAQYLLRLSANVTWIRDLSPLAGCTNLEELSISDTLVDSLAPISGIPLYRLDIRGTGVDDLTCLNTNNLMDLDFSLDRHVVWKGLSRIRMNPKTRVGPWLRPEYSWERFDEFYANPTNESAKAIQSSWEIYGRAKYFHR